MSQVAARTFPRVDFLIVGAMKCATTAVVRGLSVHPALHLPEREVHFFDRADEYASVWRGGRVVARRLTEVYGRHFRGAGDRLTGTKAPSYMASPLAMERVRVFHPKARVVVMLRDPVARAQSHWNHLLRARDNGRLEPALVGATFREHVERDAAELAGAPHADAELRPTNILHRGHYASQVRRIRRLYPRERVFVGIHDDLRADAAGFFARLLAFLGVADDPAVAAAAEGETASRKPHTEVLAAGDREFLRVHYAAPLAELRALLGLPLDDWGRG